MGLKKLKPLIRWIVERVTQTAVEQVSSGELRTAWHA